MCNDHCCGDCNCPADQVPDGTTSGGKVDHFVDRVNRVVDMEKALIQACLLYEQAWTRYASIAESADRTTEVMLGKAETHQELIAAARNFRDFFND